MPKHLYFLIALTFIVGFSTGVYVYFAGANADRAGDSVIYTEEVEEGFEILVTVYGGCERIGCASFKVDTNGVYQYLAPKTIRDYARYEDTLSPRQLSSIENLVFSTDFAALSDAPFVGVCPVQYDGLAYRFDIRREGERYNFDSCSEDIGNEPFFVELIRYFAIMEATHGSSL